MPHTLKPLPYAHDALEPHYDKATVQIHHGKHQQAYVDNLNKALKGHPDLEAKTPEELLKDPEAIPAALRQKAANNAGGIWNHEFFWEGMGPGKGGTPAGNIGDAIAAAFGGFTAFQEKFKESAVSLFGSGWTYLVVDNGGTLGIRNFKDQDCPVAAGVRPLLGLDVWEHAYYLKFQNRRPEWVDAWWNVVDWDAVNARLR